MSFLFNTNAQGNPYAQKRQHYVDSNSHVFLEYFYTYVFLIFINRTNCSLQVENLFDIIFQSFIWHHLLQHQQQECL